MKNNNKSDYTIRFTDKALTYISRNADLNNPEAVKQFIAGLEVSNGYKKNLCYAYNHYVNYHGFTWKKPNYKPIQRLPRIPNEEKINMIISASHFKLAAKLNISEETEFRLPIERLKE